MLDNVTPMKPEKKKILRRVLSLILVAAVVCGAVALLLFWDRLNIDGLRRRVTYLNVRNSGDYGVYSFDSHNFNAYAGFDGGLAVASVGGLDTYDAYGREVFLSQAQLGLPAVETEGDLVLAYDVGGSTLLAVHRRKGEVLRLEGEKSILDADVSKGGYLCWSSSASGYKSVLSVYDYTRSSKPLYYRWLSSTTYMPLCAVSSDGRYLAAVGLGQEGGSFTSTLYLFKTDQDGVLHTASLGNEQIYDLYFLEDNTICAVGENSMQFFSGKGEPIGRYSYRNLHLKDYDDGGDGFLTLTENMYKAGSRYSVHTVDHKGREIANAYLGKEILDTSAAGKYVAVLTPESLTVYNQNMEVYAETQNTGLATACVMRADGSVLLLGGGQGKLYIP